MFPLGGNMDRRVGSTVFQSLGTTMNFSAGFAGANPTQNCSE